MSRFVGLSLLALMSLLVCSLMACEGSTDAATETDGAIDSAIDGGGMPPPDAETSSDTGIPEPTPDRARFTPLEPDRADVSFEAVSECFSDPAALCDAVDCAARVPACAVGRGDYCQAADLSDLAVREGFSAFGAPPPRIEDVDGDAFAPQGDGNYDSGWLSNESLDLRTERVVLSTEFLLPRRCETCLETVAFGFTTQETLGLSDHVTPLVALMADSQTERVLLLSGDRVVESYAMEGVMRWSLTLAPDGRVAVARDGTSVMTSLRFSPQSDARVVLFGHNGNPGSTGPGEAPNNALMRTPSLSRAACDVPFAWGRRTTVLLGAGSMDDELVRVQSPSLAQVGERTYIAYADSTGIRFTSRGDDDGAPERFTANDNDVVQAGVDPELLGGSPTDGLSLFFSQDGSIVRAETGTLEGVTGLPAFRDGTAQFAPSVVGAVAVDAPTVARSNIPEAELVMAVRARQEDGDIYLAFLSKAADDDWIYRGFFRPAAVSGIGDVELGRPELVEYGEAFHLYLPLTRGTRTDVAHFVSANLQYWRLVSSEALTGEGQLERLGVSDVDVMKRGTLLETIYRAEDGILPRLRFTDRQLVEDASFAID